MAGILEYQAGMESISAYQKSVKTDETKTKDKVSNVSDKTFGNPQLSDKAAKYYDELKKKYSNMDFVLVSSDQKELAKSQAGNFANASKMTVLIDEDKIEKMAQDENYRKQYEGIIANAASGISELKSQLGATSANVKGFGMQVNDNGTASYFAVLEDLSAQQRERIEKKTAEKKKEAKKAEAKKAEEKNNKEKLEKKRLDKRDEIDKNEKKTEGESKTTTITGSSIEDLINKVNNQVLMYKSDSIMTDYEKNIGQNIDFKG